MSFTIRPATPEDAATILGFITELAVYEKAGHEVEATEETIRASIFGEGSVTEAVILESDGRPAGFAVWFYSYSTWQAKNGLYLEDLYVSPDHRGGGGGKMLLRHLAKRAVEKGCGRFEWSVLDWNVNAIRFYEKMGASVLPEWRICRMTGEALTSFAAKG